MAWELDPISAPPTGIDRRAAGLTVIAAPTARPVVWSEVKKHLRLDTDDDQAYVETLIDAAVDFAEESMAASVMARTLMVTWYAGEPLRLPRGPLLEVLSVVGADEMPTDDYTLRHIGFEAYVVPTSGLTYPVSIVYRAGHESASAVPAGVRISILAHVGSLYENRESVSDKAKVPVPQQLVDFYRLKRRTAGVG